MTRDLEIDGSTLVLGPIDRTSEVLFDLSRALTFTGTLSVASVGRWSSHSAVDYFGPRRKHPVHFTSLHSTQRKAVMADEDNPDAVPGYRHARWTKHFDEIDREIAQLASVCQIPLLDPGVIERVLHKDTLVCGSQNARAFDKLRSLLMMHYSVRDRAVVALGEQETMLIMKDILERLRSRYGDRLGGPPA